MKDWCKGLKQFIHKQSHRETVKGYFTTQRKREERLSPALQDRSQCLQATSGLAQHHDCRQVPAELSVLLVLTQTPTDCAQRQSPWLRNTHTRSEPGMDLTNSSDKSYPWSTFQASQESTTARLRCASAGWGRWLQKIPLALAQPASKNTSLSALPQPAVCCTRDRQQKTWGKHSTEDQFRLQNADHRPGQVWNQKMLYWKGTKKPVTAAKFTAINYVVAVKRSNGHIHRAIRLTNRNPHCLVYQ